MRQFFLSNRTHLIFASVVFAALLWTGCGSSDSSESETGSLTKAQFIKQADAICQKGSRQAEREYATYVRRNSDVVSPQTTQSEQAAAAAEIIDTVYIPAHEKEIDEIRSLGAPESDEEKVTAILDAMQRALAVAEDHPLGFLRNGDSAYRSFAKAGKLAKAYGLTVCGRG